TDTTLAMSVSVANANTFTGDLILAGSGTGRNQVSIVPRSALPAATTVKFQRDQSQFNFGGSVGTQTFANNFVLNSLGAAGTFTSYIGCNGGNIVTLNGT